MDTRKSERTNKGKPPPRLGFGLINPLSRRGGGDDGTNEIIIPPNPGQGNDDDINDADIGPGNGGNGSTFSEERNNGLHPITEPVAGPSNAPDPFAVTVTRPSGPTRHPRPPGSVASSRASQLEAEIRSMEEIHRLEEEVELRRLARLRAIEEKRRDLEIARIEDEMRDNDHILLDNDARVDRVERWVNDVDENGSISSESMYTVENSVQSRIANFPNIVGNKPNETKNPPQGFQTNRGKRGESRNDVRGNNETAKRNPATEKQNTTDPNRKNDDLSDLKSFVARQTIKRDLPKFSGKPEEWTSFKYEFDETTKACNFSNVENLHRLRKALDGKAREAVESFLVIPDHVPQIIRVLERRFGKPELIIETLLLKINKLPNALEEKPETIVEFSDKIRNLTETLIALDDIRHVFNPHMINGFVSKLSGNLKIMWAQRLSTSGEIPNLKLFSDWLDKLADVVNVLPANLKRGSDDKKGNSSEKKKEKSICSVTTSTEENATKKLICVVCKGHHVPVNCPEFEKLDIDARWKVASENKLCFRCLYRRHKKACKKPPCGVEDCEGNHCEGNHHRLLHKKKSPSPKEEEEPRAETVALNHRVSCEVLMKVVLITLISPTESIQEYAQLDDGSAATLIDEELADQLHLKGFRLPLKMRWTNKQEHFEKGSRYVSLKVKSGDGVVYDLTGARTVKDLHLPQRMINPKKLIDQWDRVTNIPLLESRNVKPRILIGSDHADLIIPREVVELGKNLPILARSKLGWTISGPMGLLKSRVDNGFILRTHIENPDEDLQELHQLVKSSFELDALPFRKRDAESLMSKDEQDAIAIIESTCQKIGDHYQIGLPWRKNASLPNNYKGAFERLKGIERKMDRDPKYKEDYSKRINYYFETGYAEKIENPQDTPGRTWYLPHFGVIQPNKPKIRVCFDAAAKFSGISLNDCLLKGGVLLNPLISVLTKFREKPIAFSGDIKEMYHQVLIRPEDRPAQRFLYREERREGPPDVYEMRVMTFGATSSPFCAQYILIKNAEMFQKEFPHVYKAVKENHYVDDFAGVADSPEEAIKLVMDVTHVHKQGGFLIQKWISNCKEVIAALPKDLRADHLKDFDADKDVALENERILGLKWHPDDDCLRISVDLEKLKDRLLGDQPMTKRKILRFVMSIFDPLGLSLPLTTRAKILLQDVWKMNNGWDTELDQDTTAKWENWISTLRKEEFSVPRCFAPFGYTEPESTQLHTFVDSSEKAYGAVSYLRVKKGEDVLVTFIQGKSRVAPLKPVTIPRLELQGAVLGIRLSNQVRDSLSLRLDGCYFWTDSMTVLAWLHSAESSVRKPDVFIRNRIAEILESSSPADWRWVPSKENPADEVTKPSRQRKWICGPDFLRMDERYWPSSPLFEPSSPSTTKEVNRVKIERSLLEALPDIERFSKFDRLIGATAQVKKYLQLRLKKRQERNLTADDMLEAEQRWWRAVQEEYYRDEVQTLESGGELKRSSKLYRLNPFLDEKQVLRIKTRLPECPVVLDRRHRYVQLLIQKIHEDCFHQGIETVLGKITEKYFILGIRPAVKRVFKSCQACKVLKAKPSQPMMAPLPPCRLEAGSPPFTHTGTDLFGPINVAIGRRQEKRWGIIFICLTSRAIHIELCASLDVSSTILAIRRFAARRGMPTDVYSDNGTNYTGSETELQKIKDNFTDPLMVEFSARNRIRWHFNPPLAPNMGGSWERMIKTVKTALNAVIIPRVPKEETILTVLIEIENIVNSRPLTHVPLDNPDDDPITPNDLIRPGFRSCYKMVNTDDSDLLLKSRWKAAQRLTDMFWSKWVKEYRPLIANRQKWHKDVGKKLGIGDVVLIVDEHNPRNVWPKGIVEKVYESPSDGRVRSVEVRTKFGAFRRPVSKLCLIEVQPPAPSPGTVGAIG